MESISPTPAVRLRRAAALLPAAAVYALLVPGTLPFYWTPFLLGVAYLAAAAVGGRAGGMWPTALVLLGWGAAVLSVSALKLGVGMANAYLIGLGAATLIGGLLARRGVAIDLFSIGGTAVLAGVVHLVAGKVDFLVKPWPYVALLAVVGGVNLVMALAASRAPGRAAQPASG